MTLETLRKKKAGVLEEREFTTGYKDIEENVGYYLVKNENGEYFIGFSIDGSTNSNLVNEEDMLEILNDKKLSDRWALDIYIQTPSLSCWMDFD